MLMFGAQESIDILRNTPDGWDILYRSSTIPPIVHIPRIQ